MDEIITHIQKFITLNEEEAEIETIATARKSNLQQILFYCFNVK